MNLGWRPCAGLGLGALFLARAVFASPPAYPLLEWQDPFWQGPMVLAQLAEISGPDGLRLPSQLLASYGWDNGFAVNLRIPVFIADPSAPTGTFPRIGGGPTNRIEVAGLFRVWGDAEDYLGITLGAALPYQSDPALANSEVASWVAILGLLGQVDFGWVTISGALNDNPSFPNIVTAANGKSLYAEGANLITLFAQAEFLAHRRLSPFLSWTETFPRSLEVGTDAEANTFVIGATQVPRTRTLALGIYAAPFRWPLVVSVEAAEVSTPGTSTDPMLRFGGNIRCPF